MCCLLAVIVFIGPRAGFLLWWLFQPLRFDLIFDSIFWPILGVIFAPWTTLMYVFVGLDGVTGFEWFLIGLAVLVDIASYGGSAYGNRDQIKKVTKS